MEDNNEFRPDGGGCLRVLVRSTLHFLSYKAINDIATFERLTIKIRRIKSNHEITKTSLRIRRRSIAPLSKHFFPVLVFVLKCGN